MITIITAVICLVVGIVLRPQIMTIINKHLVTTFYNDINTYELEFQIQFYNQPSLHQIGANGELIKMEPIKISVNAKSEKEAIELLSDIVRQEMKPDLLSIKQIQ
jgi:hypothetical protein